MTIESETPKSSRKVPAWVNFDTVLAFLITALSIITAYASYQSSAIDATSTSTLFDAQANLNDANTYYLEKGQDIIYDFSTYDSYQVAKIMGNEERAEYYYEQLSEELLTTIDQEDGPFSQDYYDAMYAEADEYYDLGTELVEEVNYDGNRSIGYQKVVLIMAVALVFAAWASLVDASQRKIRFAFTFLSAAITAIGLAQMFAIPGPL